VLRDIREKKVMYIIINEGYTGTVYWTGINYSIHISDAMGYLTIDEAVKQNKGRVIKIEYT